MNSRSLLRPYFTGVVYVETCWPMFNVHLSYKPPKYWRILFRYGVRHRQFSRLKKFRSLVIPGGVCCKGIIIEVIMTPTGVLWNRQSCLRRKGDVTGASIHVLKHSNIAYVQTVIRYIYQIRQPEHPHFQRGPQGPASRPLYKRPYLT